MSTNTSPTAIPYGETGYEYDETGTYDVPPLPVGQDTLAPSLAVPMNYSDVAFPTTLAKGVGMADKVLPVRSTAGYPTPPFQISLDAGLNTQEICLVGGVTPNSFTNVTRNYNGKGAFTHTVNAPVAHSTTAFDYTVMNHHCADSGTDWHPQYLDTFRHANPALHQCGVSLGYAHPSASNPGDVGSTGTSIYPARSDHQHPRENLTTILANSFPSGLGVLINQVNTNTWYWLQSGNSAQAGVNSPYTSFTTTTVTLPTSDFSPLYPDPNTIRGHVWTYSLIINPQITYLQR